MRRDSSFLDNKPILYLVASPIGNLQEFSLRAQNVIKDCDLVACEDTRNTSSLLYKFNINKKCFSLHEHNELEASNNIIKMIKDGKKVVYMSDAGYPCISDPGSLLVKKALENDINVSCINGSSAFLTALVGSGFDIDHFYFHGFLDTRKEKCFKELKRLKERPETLIFYESPHRIRKTLSYLLEVFEDRYIVIARELTKIHEEYIRGTLSEVIHIDESSLIGEMVLIVEGKKEKETFNKEDIINIIKKEKSTDLKGKSLISYIVNQYNIPKNDVYDAYLSFKEEKNH